jgi:hypothetical protein
MCILLWANERRICKSHKSTNGQREWGGAGKNASSLTENASSNSHKGRVANGEDENVAAG